MAQLRCFLVLFVAVFAAAAAAQDEPHPDPWEPFNRRVFAFNEWLDQYALKPVAQGYRAITPDPVERGVTNFIGNIYELNSVFNSALQGRADNAIRGLGRFVLNSTVGLAGFMDVATRAGVERHPADFDQTLAVWGLDRGPFLMLPVLGPRTVRSGAGSLVDGAIALPSQQGEQLYAWGFLAAEAIDVRAELLRAEDLVTGDRYIFVRNTYLQHREMFIHGGKIEDDFSDFEEGAEFEEF